jgi:hypothetical protein
MQQQTRVFEFSSGAREGAAGTLRFDVTEASRAAFARLKQNYKPVLIAYVPYCNLNSHALIAALRYHRP